MSSADEIIFAVMVVLMVRNVLTYKCRNRRCDEIHAENIARIDRGEYDALLDYGAELGSHVAQLLDLLKWTYRQFYPKAPGEPQ